MSVRGLLLGVFVVVCFSGVAVAQQPRLAPQPQQQNPGDGSVTMTLIYDALLVCGNPGDTDKDLITYTLGKTRSDAAQNVERVANLPSDQWRKVGLLCIASFYRNYQGR